MLQLCLCKHSKPKQLQQYYTACKTQHAKHRMQGTASSGCDFPSEMQDFNLERESLQLELAEQKGKAQQAEAALADLRSRHAASAEVCTHSCMHCLS